MITLAENPFTSPAWLGYRCDKTTGDLMVAICAWCPVEDKRPAELESERLRLQVTHGICAQCAARVAAEVTGELFNEEPEQ